MKYLQLQQFVNVSTLLTDFDLGDRVINGRIEGYSCKYYYGENFVKYTRLVK